jgi:hypothetical protein
MCAEDERKRAVARKREQDIEDIEAGRKTEAQVAAENKAAQRADEAASGPDPSLAPPLPPKPAGGSGWGGGGVAPVAAVLAPIPKSRGRPKRAAAPKRGRR